MVKANSKKEFNSILQNKTEAVADELLALQEQHKDLQLRYNALFNLNRLAQECEKLDHFYPKVHSTIATLMTAENFYIVTYDQTFSTLEFVYYVDEQDEKLEGVIDYEELNGSFTHSSY